MQIQGRVQIAEGTRIEGDVLIRGPVAIGRHCLIRDSYIGPYTSIGDNAKVVNTQIENTLIMENANINSGVRIVDSLIGKNVTITPEQRSMPSGHKMILGDNSVVEL